MVRDFLIGLLLFGAILSVTTLSPFSNASDPSVFSGAALAGQFTMPADAQGLIAAEFKPSFTSTRMLRTPEQTQGLLILGLVFSTMVALNLAFLRHLRRVYASPRQGAWRRGS
jgi:hypothetical protein